MQFIKEIFQPTVAGALKQFKAAAAKLERVTAHHNAAFDLHSAAADAAKFRADAAATEAQYAAQLRSKFADIFGV